MLVNLILINGLSFLFFILLQFAGIKSTLLSSLPLFLLIFSFPHFILTYWVWLKRVGSWKNEWWALVFPLMYSCLFFFLYFNPTSFLTIDEVIRFSYGYLLYHFVQQLYGVTLWLCYQYKSPLSKWHKLALRGFFLMSGVYAYFDLELRGGAKVLFYRDISPVNFPSEFVLTSFLIVSVLLLINFIFIFKNYFKAKEIGSFAPVGGLIVSALWFIPPFGHQMVLFLPILHALQYFPFIFMKVKKLKRSELLILFGAAVFLGWVCFRVLPFSTLSYLPSDLALIFPAFLLTLLNNHHFLIDGRIWKLRDEKNQELFFTAKVPGNS